MKLGLGNEKIGKGIFLRENGGVSIVEECYNSYISLIMIIIRGFFRAR